MFPQFFFAVRSLASLWAVTRDLCYAMRDLLYARSKMLRAPVRNVVHARARAQLRGNIARQTGRQKGQREALTVHASKLVEGLESSGVVGIVRFESNAKEASVRVDGVLKVGRLHSTQSVHLSIY